jgi:hypothetical protein
MISGSENPTGASSNKGNLDMIFKNAMEDSYILATILKGLVDEYRDMEIEEIRACLPIREGRKVAKGNTEFINANNEKIELDNFFEIDSPDNRKIGILMDLEGQGDPNPSGYSLIDRAVYYTSTMISNQKGIYFEKSDYSGLRKTVSLWVILDPSKKDRNKVTDYVLCDRNSDDRFYDREHIITINISDPDDSPDLVHGVLNTLFGGGLNDRERAERLESKYNIPDADYIYGQIRGISMSIEEELHASWGKHAIEDGIEAGDIYTKDQYEEVKGQYEELKNQYGEMKNHYGEMKDRYEEVKAKRIADIYRIVLKMIQNGMPMDEAIDMCVPDDIRTEIRRKLTNE